MGVTLAQLRSATNRYLKYSGEGNLANFTQADRDEIINDAIREYSLVRPCLTTQIVTGTTQDWYSLPSDYEDGFSSIVEIEYPVENSPKDVIDPKYWAIEQMSDGKYLRFDENNPGAGNIFWVKFTKRQVLTNGTSDIPDSDLNPIAYLATSLMCEALADFYGSRADANLTEVEIPGFTSRVGEFTEQARKWRKKYDALVKQSVTGTFGQIDFLQNAYFDRNEE
jgi:hypothetical protein